MVLNSAPQVVVDQLYLELELNEQLVNDSVRKLTEWIHMQPHLPQINDDKRLKLIFLRCRGRMEIAKSALDMYFSLRTHIPEILSNRDPFEQWFKDLTNRVMVVTLPDFTEDFNRVTVFSAIRHPPDIETFDVMENMKLTFMVQDIRLAEDMALGDIVIVDAQKGTPAHAAKFTPSFFNKVKLCASKAYKVRITAIHILNVSPFMDTVVSIVKGMMKEEYRNRLVVHRDCYRKGYDSLHAYIPPKILPKEYGGESGSLSDMWDEWKTKICSYRDWFVNEGAMKSDESKRPGKAAFKTELFGFEGSFRKLSVD